MKVEVDEVYCCGYEMERKETIDVDTKNRTFLFVCPHCKDSFELKVKSIKSIDIKRKMASNEAIILSNLCPFFARFNKKSYDIL